MWHWRWQAGIGQIVCFLALTACVAEPVRYSNGVTASRVITVQREYLPAFGGQTIQAPQRMADVTTLWMPLTAEEYSRIASQTRSRRMYSHVPDSIMAWLPPSEKKRMEDFLFRLKKHDAVTQRVLDRAKMYLPMVNEVLATQGLPLELAALPLVESAFELRAVSSAGAAGLWQLMPATARRFGLIVTATHDERFDARKSTIAAARYLRWLHEYFGDWPVALAAYNCGEGAMQTFLQVTGTESLAELSAQGAGIMPDETLAFVPRFVAAATVMKWSGCLQVADKKPRPVSSATEPSRQSVNIMLPQPMQSVPGMRRLSQ